MKQPVKVICGMLKNNFKISFMAISKTFHNITSSKNNVYIKQVPTYFFNVKCDIEIRLIDLLRYCRPLRTCNIDLGETGNHLHRRDRKNVQLDALLGLSEQG